MLKRYFTILHQFIALFELNNKHYLERLHSVDS